ncbi:helix-turn-helix transcriptional regulator [Streptomyces olivoreticuli]
MVGGQQEHAEPGAASGDATPTGAGAHLRRLRHERGVSLAALSRLSFYSKGYLSKVENGEKPLTVDVARACDRALETGGVLERSATAPDKNAGPADAGRPGTEGACPYRGLSAYGPDDAPWFFGRDEATAVLVAQLTERLDGAGPLLVIAEGSRVFRTAT